MAAADNTVKLSKKHRSNSVKVAALTALKSGVSPDQISKELEIPPSTLRQWRKVSMESGDWGAAGDSGIPALPLARMMRTVKHPPKILGCFRNSKIGRIYFVERNQKMNSEMYQSVLTKHLTKSMKKTGTRTFMQDGAPCHTSKRMKMWFAKQNIKVLPWVGQSPDLNPIENLWTQGIIGRTPATSNMDEFIKNINITWKKLEKDTDYLNKLTHSMPKRVQAVIEAGGNITKY